MDRTKTTSRQSDPPYILQWIAASNVPYMCNRSCTGKAFELWCHSMVIIVFSSIPITQMKYNTSEILVVSKYTNCVHFIWRECNAWKANQECQKYYEIILAVRVRVVFVCLNNCPSNLKLMGMPTPWTPAFHAMGQGLHWTNSLMQLPTLDWLWVFQRQNLWLLDEKLLQQTQETYV